MQTNMRWLDSLEVLAGVGPKRLALFQALGIYTIKDVLFHFPFRYELIKVRDLASILDQEKVTLQGEVITPAVVNYYGAKKSKLSFRLAVQGHEIIQVVFFNQPYRKQQIHLGQSLTIYGKWDANKQTLMAMKLIQIQDQSNDFNPVYSTVKGLKQEVISQTIRSAFDYCQSQIEEILPAYLNDKYQLISLAQALFQMHFPANPEEKRQATRKIVFQECFAYQWQLQTAFNQHQLEQGVSAYYDNQALKEVIKGLPYELTPAQKQAVNEICYDLMAPFPMRRMLQGDVGSGKTVVAFLAIIATILAGYQTVLMVPTEILAKQHFDKFQQLFADWGYQIDLLVSAMPAKDKKRVKAQVEAGTCQLVIGTHALIQEDVTFHRLGLIVIDEQHRFGVGQRQALLEKTRHYKANLLQMTATPIPRSLAQTLYGDMRVSTINELPKGRKPIETYQLAEDEIEKVYQVMTEAITQGQQVYYVLPLIEASDALDQVRNVTETVTRLQERFATCAIVTLHGQMDKAEQVQTMQAFYEGKADILVATTMVEVGVDVPNATVMVIQSAERFGLAQLHQLRGRVGRGAEQSYCFLIGRPTTEQGKARLETMAKEHDGFKIAQADMQLRGMGDVLGRNQSGLPQFHYANVFEDQAILNVAQAEVQAIISGKIWLSEVEFSRLNALFMKENIEI